MKVKHIELKNYRSISNVTGITIGIGDITAIAGANDSGKSAFLLGSYLGLMGLFGFPKGRDITYHRYIGRVNKHNSYSPSLENNDPIMARITIVFEEMDLDLFLPRVESWSIRDRQVRLSDVTNNFSGVECVFDVNIDALFNEYGQVATDSVGFQRWFNTEETALRLRKMYEGKWVTSREQDEFISEMVSNFNKEMLWNAIPSQVLYIPAERYIDPSQWNSTQQFEYKHLVDFKLGVEPRELLQYVASLEAEGNERIYSKFVALLNMLYPIENVRIRNTAFGNDIFVEQAQRSHPLSRSGTGIGQIMYACARTLAASEYVKSGLTVILFDEPETGLHPGLQRALIKLMTSMGDLYPVQWILGSHSPFIFNEIDTTAEQKLCTIAHDGRKSTVRSVDHPDVVKDLYTNIGLHIPSILIAKALILCEGISEANFLPEALRKAGTDVKLQSIVIVPFGGIGNLRHIMPADLLLLHPRIMLVLDWDDGAIENNEERERFLGTDIQVYCNREYRSFENSYPADAVAKAFDCEAIPRIGVSDDYATIKNKISEANPRKAITRKARMAEKVAVAMTDNQCREHPLVKNIQEWLRQKTE